jgi:molybdate transport system substrate-binding protein
MPVRVLLLLLLAPAALAADVRVFAAASLTEALREISAVYEKTSGDRIVLNLAASSLLERQIEHGAPADLFVSADDEKMNALARANLIDQSSRYPLLSNSLVVVVARDRQGTVASAEGLRSLRRIAIAEPSTVPAGIYARRWLEGRGVWKSLAGKLVPTENVRAALAAVAGGNADAALVYRSDVTASRNVKIAFAVPVAETPAISYPVAILRSAKNATGARRFLAHLRSETSAQIFRKHGFIVPASR